MKEIEIDVRLSAEDFLAFYRGVAKSVLVRTRAGQRVSFPAEMLRPYVTEDGICGGFAISFNDGNKIQGIRRLAN